MPEFRQRLEDLFAVVQRIFLLPSFVFAGLHRLRLRLGRAFFPDFVQYRYFQVRHDASTLLWVCPASARMTDVKHPIRAE
jgi:hypothetical protein